MNQPIISPFALFPLLYGATIIQRILELRRSRRNQKSLSESDFVRVDSGRSFVMMVAVHCSWFAAMLLEHLLIPHSLPAFIGWIALGSFFSAQTLRFWVIRTLAGQWNVNIMSPTAKNDSATPFVESGPYRFIRHPNYLAIMIEFLSLPLIGKAPLTALLWSLLNALILRQRIRQEETCLFQRPGYREQMGGKPLLFPWRLPGAR